MRIRPRAGNRQRIIRPWAEWQQEVNGLHEEREGCDMTAAMRPIGSIRKVVLVAAGLPEQRRLRVTSSLQAVQRQEGGTGHRSRRSCQ